MILVTFNLPKGGGRGRAISSMELLLFFAKLTSPSSSFLRAHCGCSSSSNDPGQHGGGGRGRERSWMMFLLVSPCISYKLF